MDIEAEKPKVVTPEPSQKFDEAEAKARIQRVFKYLQELHRVKTPPIISLEQYNWKLNLDSIPVYPSVQKGKEGEFVLKVSRPKEEECPQPSVKIENWLKPGFEDYGEKPKYHKTRKTKNIFGKEVSEKFEDSKDRVEAFEDFVAQKAKWTESQKQVIDALGIFSNLFALRGRFERESERYQLYLADGILQCNSSEGRVNHPIILQRVELVFNPAIPEFTIVEADEMPEINSSLLRFLGVDGKGILEIRDIINEEAIHPFQGTSTSEFLKEIVQRFWENGRYYETEKEIEEGDQPTVFRKPLLFLGVRGQGFQDAIEKFIDKVPTLSKLPESLLRVVGIESGERADPGTKPVDLLLTKHANPEQERVIRQLEETGAVLVQGPPGTGKSHTIANLIGHLLAQKKSILVTSHTSKALRVVRHHVAEPIQPLCVSVLHTDEDSTRQLEESVSGIINYLSKTSLKKLDKELETIQATREDLKQKCQELKGDLYQVIASEYGVINLLGEKIQPSKAAAILNESKDEYEWMPGPVAATDVFPLDIEEIKEVYEINKAFTSEDEEVLVSNLPDSRRLPTPDEFVHHFDALKEFEKVNLNEGKEYWAREDQTVEDLNRLEGMIKQTVETIDTKNPWFLEVVEIAEKGSTDERQSWMKLIQIIMDSAEEIPKLEKLVLDHGPKVKTDFEINEEVAITQEIIKSLKGKKEKTLKKVKTMVHPKWQKFLKGAKVDSGEPKKVEHFDAILNHLLITKLRSELTARWDRQMEALGAPGAAELGKKPEKKAAEYAEKIQFALNWQAEHWKECEASFDRLGVKWDLIVKKVAVTDDSQGRILRVIQGLETILLPALSVRKKRSAVVELKSKQLEWLAYLEEFPKNEPAYPLIKLFRQSVKHTNYDDYRRAYEKLKDLISFQPMYERRKAILGKIGELAPGWAEAIEQRKKAHVTGEVPSDPVKAWKYRGWQQVLNKISSKDPDDIQDKLISSTEKLHGATAKYVEKLAWRAQYERTGLKQQQALNGWLALHKKIGKGTGKNVTRLKEEMRKTLQECHQAVPVWIMPMSRVVENFDFSNPHFDVVIIDEASQSDVLGLAAFALGKEVVVVGDHEQVSPYGVGQQMERIQELIDENLRDIPNSQLYDGKTSVYDLARQSFGGIIRLLEHFRCVPDIIQFSNQLCYEGEIQPLREASSAKVKPFLINHAIQSKEPKTANNINKAEAVEIAAIISAMTRMEEYENCTIGVISMLGTDQAIHIDSILRRRLSVVEYQKRRLLCGNASQFQGDERDIIFLSLVDTPKEKALTLRQREEARKVYNVAVSRAKDQLFVVHSLNPGRDLKTGDLRLRLISHAENPGGGDGKKKKEDDKKKIQYQTEFEKTVYEGLVSKGFRTHLHYKVGEFVIDMVVEGDQGKRVAVVCDGDTTKTSEQLNEIMRRVMTLQRLGWTFIRLRASQFFQDPEEQLKDLYARLKRRKIHPVGAKSKEELTDPNDDLLKRVLKKANQIRGRWKEATEEIPPAVEAEAEETEEVEEEVDEEWEEAEGGDDSDDEAEDDEEEEIDEEWEELMEEEAEEDEELEEEEDEEEDEEDPWDELEEDEEEEKKGKKKK